ncbi:SMP-30/gluconolactonase/LRE family protein [Sphingobium sp.]|uniref:SMP-30/gluconolactonase/LRE family protein n=1 Tax=Sphingobium sp. TaxID=1912891 RepID=UPI0028BDE5BC|nr:SMP-30/gluconolactonase/LRE family protein [Sphingobium sp.]
MNVRRLGSFRTALGEGPYWDIASQALFFVDMIAQMILRTDISGNYVMRWKAPKQPSALTRTEDGGFIAVLADGFYSFDPQEGRFDKLADIGEAAALAEINDAKVDRQGRMVAGLKAHISPDQPLKSLPPVAPVCSFDGIGVWTIEGGYRLCNGPCWSPDGRTFYLADTVPNEIYAYDYDTDTGQISGKRLFADGDAIGGLADGATVDAAGRIWWAFCGEGRIACYNPDGTLHDVLTLEARWPSSLQFGGPDLDRLFVTSFDPERIGFAPDEHSGYVYVIEGLDAKGLPEPLAKLRVS